MHRYWPFFDLEVRTPSITLRYIDDDLGVRLCDLMQQGIHEPDFMPFASPWSTAPSPQRERDAFRHWWGERIKVTPESWSLQFAVLRDAMVIGAGGLGGKDFALVRSVATGSWLGLAHQGKGFGKEFRAALLHLAFAGLGAEQATTSAWSDNPKSLGVTRHWGYEPNGSTRGKQGDKLGEQLHFRMSRAQWETIRRDDIEIVNLDPCLDVLGLA
jgi:RimJ/RimL family protein N-acetyltransferase